MIPRRPPARLSETSDLWVAHPTAGDMLDMEARGEKPGLMLWYLVRFLVDSDGRPHLRTEEEARQVPAEVANALVARVGELATGRP